MSACRSCGTEIVWAVTVKTKSMPVEPADVGGNIELTPVGQQTVARIVAPGAGTHRSHFSTCPDARKWRNG